MPQVKNEAPLVGGPNSESDHRDAAHLRADRAVDVLDPGREDQDPPQAPDHRRNHRQQVDHVDDRARPAVRHDLGQQQGDTHADRHREHDRDQGREGCPEDEGQGAELVGRRVPGLREDLDALGGEPRGGLLAGRDGDQGEDHEHQQARRERDDLEADVTQRPPLRQAAGGSGRDRPDPPSSPCSRRRADLIRVRHGGHHDQELILLSCALACESMLAGTAANPMRGEQLLAVSDQVADLGLEHLGIVRIRLLLVDEVP